ncbi:MAG: SH3 domain-containing protein [Desulfomonile tiedjei]|nr:SH3 domain-containing protein [Desulfomonile tiedjei]
MNFAAKISLVLVVTVPLLLLGYSVFSAPVFAAEPTAPGAGVGQSQTAGTKSLDSEVLASVGAGDINRLQALLNQGANVNAKDANGISALAAAAYLGNTEVVRVLLSYGAIDSDGSALGFAQAGGHTRVYELLAQSVQTRMSARPQAGAVPGKGMAGGRSMDAVVTSVDRPDNCLRIRSGPNKSHQLVGCAALGEKMMVTGMVRNGWVQVQSPVQGWVFGRQIKAEGLFPAKAATRGSRASEESDDSEFYEWPESEEYVVREPEMYYYEGPDSGYYVQPSPGVVVPPRRPFRPGVGVEVGPLRFGIAPALPRPLP